MWVAHVRYHRTHDAQHLATLVEAYESYALSLARRMNRYREPLEDLEQIAREALISSLNRFDPDRGIPFPAFATPTILGALRRHFRDRGWSIRVPRRVHEITVARHRSIDRLTTALGRMPTDGEIASDLGISVVDLVRAEGAAIARTPNSLDAPVGPSGVPASDLIAEPDQDLLQSDNRIVL
ncbi:MAG: sigma factor, partial [Aquihabitans sp.]